MTGGDYRRRLPAVPDSVGRLVEDMEAYAEAAMLAPRLTHHLALVVEEAVANVASHATGASFMDISVHRTPGELLVLVEDDGPPFDPLAVSPADTEAALDDREPGGLGVLLIRKLSRQVEYTRDGALNRLAIRFDAPG
jgi:anti-sigma regulatory factor (Ser/Thr protein kinase)